MTTLRKVLGDDAKNPTFIENLPRKGYRFIGQVSIVDRRPTLAQIQQIVEVDSSEAKGETIFKNRRTLGLVFASCLLFLVASLGFNYLDFPRLAVSSSNADQIDSIAVLPFENQNPDTEYLSDGLTESVINSLTELPNLRVISRYSVFLYKGKEMNLQTVGRELNVRAILTGTVTQQGENLVIDAELTDVSDNKQIWGRQYSHKTSDAVSLLQEISRDVSEALRSKMTGAGQLAKLETDNAEAFYLYLKGRYLWNKRTNEGFLKAIDFFNQAIEKDPTYALAYVGLANCYLSVNFNYVITREERVAMVRAAAQKALEIDPKHGEIHATLAINSHFNEWDWATADREYKLAIELSPNYATAHHWYAEFLATTGRFEESFAEYKRALELDPLSLAISTDLGLNYYYARQTDLAIEHLKKLKEVNPNYMRATAFLSDVYEEKGLFEAAIIENDISLGLQGNTTQLRAERNAALQNAFKTSGALGYWKKVLELEPALQSGNPHPVTMAMLLGRVGDRDKAFELLEKGFRERSALLVWLKVSPKFDSLRSDPRFVDLMKRIGIP